ncbi:MAG: methylated-DNA-[protein]-cysteine S-methyltransferase, partial [Planctomycetota bacterium]
MTSHSILTTQTLSSPVGSLLLAWNERGLHAVTFADLELRRGGFQRYLRKHELTTRAGGAAARNPYATALKRYFKGNLSALQGLSLVMLGTPFQRQVWDALRAIPTGSTTSYGALAEQIGHPGAQRAVGTANGQNPVGIIVPCHRVIGSNHKLT